jgi:hypothetical protein
MPWFPSLRYIMTYLVRGDSDLQPFQNRTRRTGHIVVLQRSELVVQLSYLRVLAGQVERVMQGGC